LGIVDFFGSGCLPGYPGGLVTQSTSVLVSSFAETKPF
jgi:hypothetical protein